MQLDVVTKDDVMILKLTAAAIDAGNYEHMLELVGPFFEEDAKVILDISDVRYMDSSGLGAMTFCQRNALKKNVRFALCGARGEVSQAIDMVHLDRFVGVYESQRAARDQIETDQPGPAGMN
jgi:anti-sigma B factor antagonist